MSKLSAVTLAAGLLALAGCGSSSNTTSSALTSSTATTTATTTPTTTAAGPNAAAPAGKSLALEANPEGQLAYNKTSLSATAGKVSIAFTNSSPLEHNVTVESSSGKVLGATATFKGGTKVLSLDLKPGTYKFFCTVPGHRQAGMEGTLTVK
jgi:plastocyanin